MKFGTGDKRRIVMEKINNMFLVFPHFFFLLLVILEANLNWRLDTKRLKYSEQELCIQNTEQSEKNNTQVVEEK